MTNPNTQPATTIDLGLGLTADWIPSPCFNSRYDTKITHLIIHAMVGYMQPSIERFLDPRFQVSCHYLIGRDGRLVQMVKDENKAWHVCNANQWCLGIEHEDMRGLPQYNCTNDKEWWTSKELDVSARLAAVLCNKYSIPIENIWGHNDIRLRQYGNNHQDPGPYFPGGAYSQMIRQYLVELQAPKNPSSSNQST
jgi:N-acetyl-anhydromuramyl-L-alanine amidase AmpD